MLNVSNPRDGSNTAVTQCGKVSSITTPPITCTTHTTRLTKLTLILLAVVFGLLSACDNGTTPSGKDPGTKTGAVTGVTLDSPSISIPVNGTATLTATVLPETATNKNVIWKSDKESIATVDKDGVVTGVAVGTATITVTTEAGGKTATCDVEVTPLPASIAVTTPPNKKIYAVGETLVLTGLVVTASYDHDDYPDEVVTVNISNISGFDSTTPGEKELTITYGDKTAKFTVTVIVPVTGIIAEVPSVTVVGSEIQLLGTVTPDNASLKDIVWTVKSGLAEITDSALTASAAGTVVITATIVNGKVEDFTKEFTITVYAAGTVIVSSNADTGAGSLRQAITNVTAGNMIVIDPSVKNIALDTRLSISKVLTIEGNGVTLTPGAGMTEGASSQLMYFSGSSTTVTIRCVWFKDGRASSNGAAIYVLSGNLTLESCIISGNKTNGSSAYGGAIYNYGTLNVKGCTFYGNGSGASGGAIYNGGTLTITGNLFYGNTASSYGPVVYVGLSATVTSGGYNAVDVVMGTTSAQSGWAADATDKQVGSQLVPVSPVSFRLLAESEAAGVITALPAGYPAFDFYGDAITAPAAAGAVQSTASGSGYTLALSVNVNSRGTIGVTPEANADGLFSGSVTITATPAGGFGFGYWLVNGEKSGSTSPLTLTIAAHTSVQAVFAQVFTVDSNSDATGTATTAGTLRHAMTNAQDGDIIRLSGVTSIALASRLPNITRSITIEGNGVILTPAAGFNESSISQMMNITGGTVTISRVWFKDGRVSSGSGGAISIGSGGNLTLESCIFSGNRAGTYYGGAIDNSGTLNATGCTFYGNSANTNGGVIYNGGTLTLAGNLFYGNTAGSSGPAVYVSYSATATSLGYNAVDVAFGTGTTQSGWEKHATDKQITSQPVSPVSFRLLAGSGAAGVISALPAGYPAVDFYGTAITAPAAVGAVQSAVSGSGYALDLSVNISGRGSVSVSPEGNADGLFSGSVTITATPTGDFIFGCWLKDGVNAGNTNTLILTMTAHTAVQAVFSQIFTVDSATDTSSTTTVGTLRHAITNAQDGDIIRIGSGVTSIALASRLPSITRSITIEGNGVTLTPGSGWTASSITQLMSISSGTVTISRVWFKDGRASGSGAAINNSGNMTLESCIFSGNQVSTSTGSGGGIYNNSSGILNVKGCTFYENTAGSYGGAINNFLGTLTLTGNVFYGNTATSGSPVVNNTLGTVTSLGYNVVDVNFGTTTALCGWANTTTNDTYRTASPFDSTVTLAPLSTLAVIPQSFAANMPATDFNGETRTYPGAPGAVK